MIIPIEINENDLIYNIIAINNLILYYFIFESITKRRTLGKLITSTKVIMIDGSEPTTKDYFIRSICRIIPFEGFSFLGLNGWYDKFSKTTVVNKYAFEAAISFDEAIESLRNENI